MVISWEAFQSIYEKSKKPFWWLYSGKGKTSLIGSNSDNPNISDSLELLTEFIDTYGPGIYTVEIRPNANASRGNPIHTFNYGNVADENTIRGLPSKPSQNGFMAGVDMRYMLDMQSGYNTQLMTALIENARLKMELEQTKRDAENKGTGLGDRILGILEKRPEIIERTIGAFTGGTALIGVLDSAKTQPDEQETEHMSIDHAVQCLLVLKHHLPELNINELLTRLAEKAQKDPNTLRTAIKFL